jgi:hypothetical protein
MIILLVLLLIFICWGSFEALEAIKGILPNLTTRALECLLTSFWAVVFTTPLAFFWPPLAIFPILGALCLIISALMLVFQLVGYILNSLTSLLPTWEAPKNLSSEEEAEWAIKKERELLNKGDREANKAHWRG